MSKIRSPASMSRFRISSEKVIVATPFGPNQPMNAFARLLSPVPASAAKIDSGRIATRVAATIATAAQPSLNSNDDVSSEPKTTKIPTFTISISSSERLANDARTSGRRMPSAIAHTKTAMKPLPCGSATATPYEPNATPTA